MSTKESANEPAAETTEPAPWPARILTPEAERALAEAAERRAEQERKLAALQKEPERNGRGGLDPVRYDDWEVKGIACDF